MWKGISVFKYEIFDFLFYFQANNQFIPVHHATWLLLCVFRFCCGQPARGYCALFRQS